MELTVALIRLAFTIGTALYVGVLARILRAFLREWHRHPGITASAAAAGLAAAGPAGYLVEGGRVFAVFLVAGALAHGCVAGHDWVADVQWIAVFGAAAAILLTVSCH